MKFRILLLLLCLSTFAVCTAQAPAPPTEPEATEVAADFMVTPMASVISTVVEDVALDEDDPGFLAINDQPPGEVLPFKRNPPAAILYEDYPEPDPALLASNLQLPDTDPEPDPGEDDEPFDFPEWLRTFLVGLIPETVVGWVSSILVAVGAIVRLTPTERDDEYYLWVVRLFDWLIPNKKKGGGKHTSY